MNFYDIVGQSIMVNSLKRAVDEEKVANGYILCGPKGCGKKLTAFVFATALSCKAPKGERPCDVCSSCMKFKTNNHPNIEVIKPTGASIKIKQIRQIISEISRRPYESGYKVIIIDHADKMTHDAQDAFLKTLEEPPESTVFILLAENQHSLLPTVVSRCQVFTVKPVGANEVEAYLRKHHQEKSDYEIKLASAYANGIIGRAVQILSDENYFKQRNTYISILEKLFKRSYIEASEMLAANVENKAAGEQFIEFLFGWFRDVMIYREMGESCEPLLTNGDRLEDIASYSSILTDNKLNDIMEIIKNTAKYINSNVSIKNSMDAMLLNMMEVNNG